RILEAARERKAVLHGHMCIGKCDICLPDGSLGHLARHHPRLKAWRALLHKETAHIAIIVTGPDNRHVGKRGIANPTLGPVNDVLVTYTVRTGLQSHCVRAMVWLGQTEGPNLLQPGHCWQPALLLFLRTEHGNG